MKFVVDAYGTDKGEEVVVRGCADALSKRPDLEIIIVGNSDILSPILANLSYDKERLEIVDAKDTISNNESPTKAIKDKPQSKLALGCDICHVPDDKSEAKRA